MNEQNPFANMHGDVLNQTPTSDDQRERLVVELKSRGNKAFGARRMEEANILYSRAIELDGSMHALWEPVGSVPHHGEVFRVPDGRRGGDQVLSRVGQGFL